MTEKDLAESIEELTEQLRRVQIRRRVENEKLQAIEENLVLAIQDKLKNRATTKRKEEATSTGPAKQQNTTSPFDYTKYRNAPSAQHFVVGDKIKITNKIGKFADPANPSIKDSIGTVTGVDVVNKKVHFLTHSGVTTWRAPHNLRILSRKQPW